MKRAFVLSAFVVVAACKKETAATPDAGAPATSTSVSSSSRATGDGGTPAATAGKEAAWSLKYSSALGTLYIPAEKDWAHTKFKNEESKYLGDGTLSMTVDPSGRVTGAAEGGPLGAAVLDGFSDGETLTANVRRKDPSDDGLTGTLVAKIAGDTLAGTMKLADTNAAVVREAKVTGTKGAK
jgi:hypothetical protein